MTQKKEAPGPGFGPMFLVQIPRSVVDSIRVSINRKRVGMLIKESPPLVYAINLLEAGSNRVYLGIVITYL